MLIFGSVNRWAMSLTDSDVALLWDFSTWQVGYYLYHHCHYYRCYDITAAWSWTASFVPWKKWPKPTNPIGSRIIFLSHHFSRLHLEKELCFRCGLGLRWTGLNSWKCWSWKMFLGNHWRFMSLVTSWKKYWLNDSIIMLMVFNRRNACKHFSFSIPLAPWDWYLYLHGWLIFNGTCRYIYSSPIGAASGNMSWSVFCDRQDQGLKPWGAPSPFNASEYKT